MRRSGVILHRGAASRGLNTHFALHYVEPVLVKVTRDRPLN